MSYYLKMNKDEMAIYVEGDKDLLKRYEGIVGQQLLDFIYYDLRDLNDLLDQTYSLATNMRNPGFDYFLKRADDTNIYFRFFVELFLETITSDTLKTKKGFEDLCNRFSGEASVLKKEAQFANISYRSISKPFLIGIFSLHAMGMQEFMKTQLEFCVNSNTAMQYSSLSPTERLYIYEQWRKAKGEQPLYFETNSFFSQLVITEAFKLNIEFSIDELANMIKAKKPEISEMTVLDTGWALMRYELMKLVTQGVVVKRCANCSRYFIPGGRSDTEYCSRPLEGQSNKTCQTVGALARHQDKIKSDPVYKEYKKAYKRYHSRVRTGSMKQVVFFEWSEKAQEKRDLCIAGKLDFDKFVEWLNKDRVYKRTQRAHASNEEGQHAV